MPIWLRKDCVLIGLILLKVGEAEIVWTFLVLDEGGEAVKVGHAVVVDLRGEVAHACGRVYEGPSVPPVEVVGLLQGLADIDHLVDVNVDPLATSASFFVSEIPITVIPVLRFVAWIPLLILIIMSESNTFPPDRGRSR